MSRKVLSVVGARPQFVKAAAVSRAFQRHASLHEVMIHTGQHFDAGMSDVFFEELGIPAPKHNLGISGGSHGKMTGRMLEGLESVMLQEQPDMVLIYGDTNSTLAAALAAAKLVIPVAHIEAGLRSFNRAMPEEINRVMADHVSDLLFCPTGAAAANLTSEGINQGVFNVGDVMYDSTLFALKNTTHRPNIQTNLGVRDQEYALATVHRAENTDDKEKLADILGWLKDKARGLPIVLPLHPRTKIAAERFDLDFAGLILCDPLGYLDMTQLLSGSKEVYTDSGGVQKEAYFHRKPCITLRSETEWVETIECGWNRLWKDPNYRERREIDEYGKGNAAELILAQMEAYFRS